ncbi:LysR family transcriptional regulator [Neptuniibacter sp. CAU 1671]|uniref:LysR family transcriptional regulator n=1 Tax=Neptuniibacter sp. CAU 1671 TaxID=3032593 RepID=UPI0023DB83DF|nr:LysR family transcriptional regulator [Neptuniibacter sp. CAU 1671]MDF2181614.1 LysR family transcriptional regulator [Neptuniibacter sp. CAU 1671]
MNWEGVCEFVAVAETGSFTAAARQLNISTAQVSRQVNKLENRLSSKLLYRTTRKVSITEAGRFYYQHCRQLLDGLESAERSLQDLQQTPRGSLKITAPTTYGQSRIAPLLHDFLAEYPELEIQLFLTNKQLDLIEGGFDLAIRLGKLEDSSLMARRLAPRKLYVCASPDYLDRHPAPTHLSELNQHNCLLGTLDYWRFQERGHERHIKVRGNIRCNSGEALLDAARKGLGLVQLPDYYVTELIETGALVPVLSEYQQTGEGIWAVYPQNRHLSTKVRMLVDYLAEHLRPSAESAAANRS